MLLGALLLISCEAIEQESPGPDIQNIKGFTVVEGQSMKNGPGIFKEYDHFGIDHTDTTHRISYLYKDVSRIKADVLVTEHGSSDSDARLMHEVQKDIRRYGGLTHPMAGIVQFNGHSVMRYSQGTFAFRWLSDNAVVHIKYNSLLVSDERPLNVVKAYLKKYPPTFPPQEPFDLKAEHHTIKWIKDEMERLLWFAEKSYMMNPEGEEEQEKAIESSANQLYRFQFYRSSYFGTSEWGDNSLAKLLRPRKPSPSYEERMISLGQRKKILRDSLTKFREWWNANRERSITLPEEARNNERHAVGGVVGGVATRDTTYKKEWFNMVYDFLLLLVLALVMFVWRMVKTRKGVGQKKDSPVTVSLPLLKLLRRPYSLILVPAILMSSLGWLMQVNNYGMDVVKEAVAGGASIKETVICREFLEMSGRPFLDRRVVVPMQHCPYGGRITTDSKGRLMCDKHGYAMSRRTY